ncbi:MAG TPA: hypothetical protein VMN58_01050 [Acidimicrobiales bacterium]|nr:hypothetical protein [Acidimicrobiales bacterium]
MTSTRRWATLVGALTLVLALTAMPAGAAPPEVRWTSPSQTDPVLRERGPLRGEASDPDGGGIETITFTLEPDQAMEPDDPCRPSIQDGDQVQTYAGSPAVSFAVRVNLPCNGTFVATAVVRTRPASAFDEQNQATAVLRFDAAVPPLPVSGLRGKAGSEPPPDDAPQEQVPPPPSEVDEVAPDDGADDGDEDLVPQVVTLVWDPNPEPDLLRYEVHRAAPERPFWPIGSVEAGYTRYVDDLTGAKGGSYRYRVFSVREGPGSATEVVVADEPAETAVDVPGRRIATGDETTTTTQAGSASPSRQTTRSGASVRRSPLTTRDTGFEPTLDFGELPAPAPGEAEGEQPQGDPGDDAAIARFDDDDDPMPLDLLAPVAGSLVLLMGAIHLRHLAKRASESPDPVDVVVEG